MSVKIREKNKHLYLDIYQSGVRRWEKLSLRLTGDTKTDKEILRTAEEIRLQRELQVARGEHGLIDYLGAKKTLYSYLEEIASTKDKRNRLKRVLKYLKQSPNGETIQLGQITSNWIEVFQRHLLDQKTLSRNTASSYMIAINYALNKAVRDNLILKNPAYSVKNISEEEKIHDFLTTDEIQRFYNTPSINELGEEVKRAFIFAFYTGLRFSDLITLKWENIEHGDNKTYLIKVQAKTKKKVTYELNKTAYEVINDGKLHNRNDFVFPLLSTTKTDTNRYLKKISIKAGIDKNITWHTARRSNATLLHESGADIYTIKSILGHSNVTTTQKYAQITNKVISKAINALPEIKIDKEKQG